MLPVVVTAQPAGVRLATAAQTAARSHPTVLAAEQGVAAEQAALRAASAAFDPQLYASAGGGQAESPLTALQRQSVGGWTTGQDYQHYEVGVRREFRSGLEVTPLVQARRTNADGAAAVVETTAGVSLAYPLLGGRPRNTNLAAEEAGAQRVTAATRDHTRSAELAAAEAAFAYWSYVGASRVHATLVETEHRAARLLADTEALVASDERPAADLVPLQADLARRRAALLSSAQSVYDARQQLGLAMGASADAADALGPPADPLPDVPEAVRLDEAQLVARALEARSDLQAAALRVRALQREVSATRADRRPSVDIVVDAGYTGLSEGSVGPHQYLPLGIGSVRGGRMNVSVRLNRLGHRATDAAFERQAAALARAQIAHDDLVRRIRADVAGAVASLRSGAAETAQARATVALYEQAVGNERQRLRLGMGTLFDVQITEERFANAQTAAVQAEVRFAQALVRLHAATGTALDPGAFHALPTTSTR